MKILKCLVIAMCLLSHSCSNIDTLTLSKTNVVFTSDNGQQQIIVAATIDWKVMCEANWLYVFSDRNVGNGIIYVFVAPNYKATSRSDKVLVMDMQDKVIKEIAITQQGATKVIPWINNIEALLKHNENKITISEGLWGTIILREGNCMPTGGSWNSCRYFPVQREIMVYEYTFTKLGATTTCDEEGFFEFQLEPGKYSVFVKENGQLYPNVFDGTGGISPATVESSKVSKVYITINYAGD